LLGESIVFVGIVRQQMNLFDLLIKIVIRKEGILRNLLLFLQTSNDLNHHFRVLLDEFFINVVLGKKFHHVRSQTLDTAWAI